MRAFSSEAVGDMPAVLFTLALWCVVSVPQVVFAGAQAADPARRQCLATCKASAKGCKHLAADERDASKTACALDPATQRACNKTANANFKLAATSCRTAKKACRTCCKQGGAVCARPPELPPPFATGTASADVALDPEGCLFATGDVVTSTDLGVTAELAGATCMRRWDGGTITGPTTVRIDDAGGILAQGSPGFLQGVIRLVVDAAGVGEQFVAFETPATIRVELDDGSLPGSWEAVTWAEGDTYAVGPASGGLRPEVSVTVVPIRRDGPEEFQYWGSGPVGIRYVPPSAALERAQAVAPGVSGLNTVSLDLLQAGLPPNFATTHPLLCQWLVTAPRTAQVLSADLIPAGLPHGETRISRGYRVTILAAGTPAFEVQSPFFNRLIPTGAVCDGSGAAIEFNEAQARAAGGSPEEAHLPGPYDGRIVLLLGGERSGALIPLTQQLRAGFTEPRRVLVRSYREFSGGFALRADLFGHVESVRTIPSALPPEWRYDFDDRHAVVNTTPTTTSTTTTLPTLLRVLECTRSAFAEGVAVIRDGLSDSCSDSASAGETSASCVATAVTGDTTASGNGAASFTSSVAGGEVVPSVTASVIASGGASGGGTLVHGASGSGIAQVRCFVAVDAPVSFSATGGGSASPSESFSTAQVLFRVDGGATIARFEQAGGEVFNSFPASGTLVPGFYEVLVLANADANLVRGGAGSADASFTLSVASN
jgi:hypothetical protein